MVAVSKPASKKSKGCLIGCLGVIVVIIIFFVGLEWFRRYTIVTKIDKDAFKPYERTSEITNIAETITLTEKGKDIFYKAEPRLVDAASFVKFCDTKTRGIEGLACKAPKPYAGPFAGHSIFLLKITDPRFIDHKYSASAHELLHLVYDRLSEDEKSAVNTLLEQELTNHRDDIHLQRVLDQMKQAGKSEKDLLDELHSKFGVEYAEISPQLEEYYRQYFTNQQKVVALYTKGGFGSRVRRMDELMQQAEVAKSNGLVAEYNAKAAEINRLYNEVQEFYALFKPDYTPPKEQEQ